MRFVAREGGAYGICIEVIRVRCGVTVILAVDRELELINEVCNKGGWGLWYLY